MTDVELIAGYKKYYRDLSWDDLMDQICMYDDFPKMRAKDGQIAELAYAEYHRRWDESRRIGRTVSGA